MFEAEAEWRCAFADARRLFRNRLLRDEPTEVDNEWANHAHGELLKLTVGYERDRHALVGTALADKSNLAQLPSNIRKGD